MKKCLIALAVIIPLAGLGGLAFAALPVMAESSEDDSCVVAPATDVAGALDLEAIPTQTVTGPLSIRGAGGDCDEDEGYQDGGHDEGSSNDD